MGATLKGTTKVKLEQDYKAGDEVELKDISFEADQTDFERALRGRLDQAKRQHEASVSDLTKQIEDLKNGAPKPDEALKLQVDRLSNELANAKLQTKIDAQLKKAGLSDLPDAYRGTIRLKADASDDDVQAEVDRAGKEFAALKESLGGDKSEPKPKPNIGNPGNGGSGDPKNKMDTMRDKVKRNRPDLIKHLDGIAPEQQAEVMESWESQGILTPKK